MSDPLLPEEDGATPLSDEERELPMLGRNCV